MSLGIARVAINDEEEVKKFMKEIFKLKYFNGKNLKVKSPDIIKDVWLKIIEFTGKSDPMREIKDEQNSRALTIYSHVKELVFKSRDPLLGAVKLAILGNSIDAMTNVTGESPEVILERWHRLEMDNMSLELLKGRLEKTRRLVYLGDNCGEIVFDKLLIEVLLKKYPLEIFFITRTLPVMNDATLHDANSIGIGEIVKVMENGIQEPIPGTDLRKINSETKALIERSDLVLSKGGGNYDSLTEEEGLKGKVSFLFAAKCYPYCNIHQVSLNAPVIYNY
jgi:uncharacterized protein with ATP-grasp and redox domains